MRASYQAIIFDWDGTLLDSTSHIISALQAACRDMGLREPPADEAGWVIGLSLQAALYKLVPELGADRVDDFIACYRRHFSRQQNILQLFHGHDLLLHDLQAKGVIMGVATGKSRRGLDASMDTLGVRSFFHASRCADETRGKPDPEMLNQLLDELDLAPESVLMVGDTTHDVLMAQAAGVDSLAVSYGAHAPETLIAARPTALAGSVPEMQGLLRACT